MAIKTSRSWRHRAGAVHQHTREVVRTETEALPVEALLLLADLERQVAELRAAYAAMLEGIREQAQKRSEQRSAA